VKIVQENMASYVIELSVVFQNEVEGLYCPKQTWQIPWYMIQVLFLNLVVYN
jgi:hypothetical protein